VRSGSFQGRRFSISESSAALAVDALEIEGRERDALPGGETFCRVAIACGAAVRRGGDPAMVAGSRSFAGRRCRICRRPTERVESFFHERRRMPSRLGEMRSEVPIGDLLVGRLSIHRPWIFHQWPRTKKPGWDRAGHTHGATHSSRTFPGASNRGGGRPMAEEAACLGKKSIRSSSNRGRGRTH